MKQADLDSQLEGLFRSRPELRLALPYLKSASDAAQLALAGIERQWIEAVYAIGDDAVAASKMRWWADELVAARDGHTHHPLATALFAGAHAREIAPGQWRAAIEAGIALRERPPARDFAEQLAAAETFHGALARLETDMCFGSGAEPARAARVATLAHLLSALVRVARPGVDNDVLPMQRLARHALDRASLARDGAARRQAVIAQLRDLQKGFAAAMSLDGPLSLARELSLHADRAQLAQALKSASPLDMLASPRHRLGPAMAWKAWRAGRRHSHAVNGHPA